ncbi:MAG: PGPGW domain-containing protein [Acidobacteriia bacterium]|nr:PGPGW domain-containing protein [Terriglobia bacterium]
MDRRDLSACHEDRGFLAPLAGRELQGFLKEGTTQTKFKRLIVLLLGWSFIALGVVGLFLPVLQGVLFLLVGLFILSSEYVWAHRLLQQVRNRFPTAALRCEEASRKAHDWLGRVLRRTGQKPR